MKITALIILISILSLPCLAIGQERELVIVAPQDVLLDYNELVGKRRPIEIQDYSGKKSRRDVVELILVQQALELGNFKEKIKIIAAPSDARLSEMINTGAADLSATTYWQDDITSDQNASITVIKQGQFEAGFYTSSKNTKALSAKNLDDLRKLTAISNKDWKPDWTALTKLKVKQIQNVVLWESMVKMVEGKRGDYLLAPFQENEEMTLESEGIKLIPIPNLKIALTGNRSYIISKQSQFGPALLRSLNTGLQILLKKKIFEKAYRQSGFFNPRVKKWTLVN